MIKDISINNISFKINDNGYEEFWENFSSWEVETFDFLGSNSSKDQIFIDCGAWIGPVTIVAAKLGMIVYSYEPDPLAFKALKENISINTFKFKPKIYNYGLSNFEGTKNFYSNGDHYGKSESSLIDRNNLNLESCIKANFKIFSNEINEIQKINNDKKIKILKIDIEGGEFLIEREIYNFIKKAETVCMLSYHHFFFNKNKIKKNFYKLRTIFFQFLFKKLDNKNLFQISNFFKKN